MLKRALRGIATTLCIVITSTIVTSATNVDDLPLKEKYMYESGINSAEEYSGWMKYPYYASVENEYKENGYKSASGKDILVTAQNTKVAEQNILDLQKHIHNKSESVYIWEEKDQWAEWEFDVITEGLYEIEIEYFMFSGMGNPAVRSLIVDGRIPFIEAGSIMFQTFWKDIGDPIVNSIGDEVRPSQVEVPGWRKVRLTDSSGFYSTPFRFYFTPGKHTIRMEYIDQSMAISTVSLVPARNTPTYQEVEELYKDKGYKEVNNSKEFEAESTVIEKSDPTIRRETNGDPSVRPVSYMYRKLNVMGGYRWRRGNQSITWEFTVPEDGLYKIAIREQQVWNDGLPSFRQIAIDGEVPFKEFEAYSFSYERDWKLGVLNDHNGKPYLIYLDKGRHTLTMTVKMGALTPVIQSINDDNILLSNMMRDILKITGSNPDPNYDYELFKLVPTLKGDMETIMDSLQKKYDYLRKISGKLPAMANNFLTIKSQLSSMVRDPFSIARRMNDLNNAQNSLGTWYLNIQNQPLLVDYFKVGAPKEVWKDIKSNIFQKVRSTFANYLISFRKDYDNIGSVLEEDIQIKSIINVWISRGIEWAELIKEMVDEEFTPNTGIMVNINVLPANQLQAGNVNALMLSLVSGQAPDIGLGLDSGSPVEFAIRDAAYDLSKFKDYEQVAGRFIKNIMIPYQYSGGVYALPETMDFQVLFYRKDIISDLGIKVPDTREDLYNHVLPILYQNGLEFNYPQDFTQFLFQHEGEFYTSDGMRSALDTEESFRAFQEFTELFTSYGIPAVSNFYNRMRTGEMPMGIGGYGLYIQLSVAAPELAGKWGIAPLPGTRRPDGIVDRSNGALAGQCGIILNQTDHPDEAWEFLKWWSSTSVQTKFARELEALIGAEARWNSANIEAFTRLSWKKEDLDVILEQWKWARETPVVLGGYFTGRHVANAWNSTVIGGSSFRDALEKAVKEINRELRMKQEEYGVVDNQR